MNTALEVIVSAIGGSLIYAARGWFGKQLLTLLFFLLKIVGKWILRMSEKEIKAYQANREQARQSGIARAQKKL